MGYKPVIPASFNICFIKFYLNYVGYKQLMKAFWEAWKAQFYLNYVGYKHYTTKTIEKMDNQVLSELCGI